MGDEPVVFAMTYRISQITLEFLVLVFLAARYFEFTGGHPMSLAGFVLVFVSVAMSALGQACFKAGVDRVSFADGAGVLACCAALVLSPWVLGMALIVSGLCVMAFGR